MKVINKNLILSLLFTFSLSQVISCEINKSEYGSLLTKIKFPDKSFSVKTIPLDTQFIIIQLNGTGLIKPIIFDLRKESSVKIIENLPKGNKNITVKAFNDKSELVAYGADNIDIIPDRLNRTEINLKINALKVKDPCVVFIDKKDMPLSKDKEEAFKKAGCEIVLPKSIVETNIDNQKTTTTINNDNVLNQTYKPLPPVTFPSPATTKKPCNIFLSEQDIPLSGVKEKIIKDSGCQIIYPSIVPTISQTPIATSTPITEVSPTSTPIASVTPIVTATPTPYSGGGGNSFTNEPSPVPSINLNIDVIDGSPLPDDTTITGR